MKDINKLKGKKIAIKCNNVEEFVKIASFDPKKRLQKEWYIESPENNCIDPSEGISYGYSEERYYIEEGYTIIDASEFLQSSNFPLFVY